MNYWEPKVCATVFLQTRDFEVLKKCDPKRKGELQSLLIQAQQKLQKMAKPQQPKQQLQKSHQTPGVRQNTKVIDGQTLVFDEWQPGLSYVDNYNIPVRYKYLSNED